MLPAPFASPIPNPTKVSKEELSFNHNGAHETSEKEQQGAGEYINEVQNAVDLNKPMRF